MISLKLFLGKFLDKVLGKIFEGRNNLRSNSSPNVIMTILVALSITVGSISISPLYSNQKLINQKKKLEQEYKELQVKYWRKQHEQLQQRKKVSDQLDNLDNELSYLLQRKQQLVEEELILRQSQSETKENRQKVVGEANYLQKLIIEILDQQSQTINSLPPSIIERRTESLNRIERNFFSDSTSKNKSSDLKKTIKAIVALLNLQKDLIQDAGNVEVYQGKIYLPEISATLDSSVIRLGFIQSYFLSNPADNPILKSDQWGILLKGSPDIFSKADEENFHWKLIDRDKSGGLSEKISGEVASGFSSIIKQAASQLEEDIKLPVDPIQAGARLKSLHDARTELGFTKSATQYFIKGGVVMYPLFALLFWSFYIIVERLLLYAQFRKSKLRILDQLSSSNVVYLSDNSSGRSFSSLQQFYQNISKHLTMISPSSHFQKNLEESKNICKNIFQEELLNLIEILEKRLKTLTVIASISPLLGLLGTVTGMIQLFDVITLYGTSNAQILAGGISVALITTQTGLGLAITLFIIHHFLVRQKNLIIYRVESKLLTTLTQKQVVPDSENNEARATNPTKTEPENPTREEY